MAINRKSRLGRIYIKRKIYKSYDTANFIGESMMQVGDLVKYLNHRTYIPPIKGVWLVINMERNNALLDEGEGKYATLKKGSNTRFAHISHIEKV